jgi:hypothetical protein
MSYSGPATLLDVNGNETEVDITIRVIGLSDLQEWRADGVVTSADETDPMGAVTLRLPNGNEGAVLVSNVRFNPGGQAAISMVGSNGPPPSL